MKRPLASLLVSLAVAGTLPVAAQPDPIAAHAWLHADRRELAEVGLTASELTLDEEERRELAAAEHPFVDTLLGYRVRVDDRKLRIRKTIVRHFLTEEGVREHGNLHLGVRAALDELHLLHASILMPDGRRRAQDLARVQVVSDVSDDIFTDRFNVVLPFEGLVPGATAVLVAEVERHEDRWPLPWALILFPRLPWPVARFELEMTWSEATDPPIVTSDPDLVDCAPETRGLPPAERRVSCVARDLPVLVPDQEAASSADEYPHLVISEPHYWQDLARSERQLIARAVEDARGLAALSDRLLEGAETAAEKLRRITRFTSDEIRYVSLSHGTSAVAPAPVSRTLERRYGDCKDKVSLFLALAERAGLDAFPVLVATDRRDPARLIAPAWNYFDHLIACVRTGDPEAVTCVETTDPHTPAGHLPPSLYGAVALDLIETDVRPRTLEAPRIVWQIDVEARNTVPCSGQLTEDLRRQFRGSGAGWLRGLLRSLSLEERQRWLIEDYQVVMGEDWKPEVSVAGLEASDGSVTLTSTTDFGDTQGEEMTEYTESESWLRYYTNWFHTDNERLPYALRGARIRSLASYQICPRRAVRFHGAELELLSPFGELRRHYRKIDGGIEVETTLELPTRTVAPEELAGFRRFLSRALDQTGIWFSMDDRQGGPR